MGVASVLKTRVFGFIDEIEKRATRLITVGEAISTDLVIGVIAAFQVLVVGLIKTGATLVRQFIQSGFGVVRSAAEAFLGELEDVITEKFTSSDAR